MLLVLSPAKTLDFDSALPPDLPHSSPAFAPQAAQLVQILRPYAPQQLAKLMGLSDKLAALNVARYGVWSVRHSAKNSRQAALAFNGDVYEGLQAHTLSAAQLQWAQEHVAILSGLYGVLRPLDWMQPYRLEMGTALPNPQGKDLYAYWRERVTHYINQRLAKDNAPVLVNLASQEYFKAVDRKALAAQVIDCVFEEQRSSGAYQIVSFMAKRARGLMARWAITHQADSPRALARFKLEGYALDRTASSPERLVFRRAPRAAG